MKRRLYRAGGEAVEPILEAITGQHGRLHPDRQKEAMEDFFDVLAAIAKKDVSPLAAALAHHVPGVNAVVWALGHSRTTHAEEILHDLRDHGDTAIQALAEHHLSRRRPRRPATAKKKVSARKTAAKKKTARRRTAARVRRKPTA